MFGQVRAESDVFELARIIAYRCSPVQRILGPIRTVSYRDQYTAYTVVMIAHKEVRSIDELQFSEAGLPRFLIDAAMSRFQIGTPPFPKYASRVHFGKSGRPAFQRRGGLDDEQQPRDAVIEQVEPVEGPGQLAVLQHHQLLPDVGREEGREPQRQAGNDQDSPGEFIDEYHCGFPGNSGAG
mgnify:CR=1 FL=1